MKKVIFILVVLVSVLFLLGCTTEEPHCGDGKCMEFPWGETSVNCPQDCKTLTNSEISQNDQVYIQQALDQNYKLCEKVVFDKPICYGQLFKNDVCNKYVQPLKDDCFYQIANSTVGLGDEITGPQYGYSANRMNEMCIKISDSILAKKCFALFGVDLEKDLNDCLESPDNNNIMSEYLCYTIYAVRSNDLLACDKIDSNYSGNYDSWACKLQINTK